MIKKVLAIALSVQLVLPLSLMASVQSAKSPTPQDVATLLDKPNKEAKTYINGILVGGGIVSFALYAAYTTNRIARLSAKNKELAKEVADLSKQLGSLSGKVSSNEESILTNAKAIGSASSDLKSTKELIETNQKATVGELERQAGLIDEHSAAFNSVAEALNNQAKAINQNTAFIRARINGPRRPVGFLAAEEKKQSKKAAKAYSDALMDMARKDGISAAEKEGSKFVSIGKRFLLNSRSSKIAIIGAAVAVTAFFIMPEQTKAARISQSRLNYTRVLNNARASYSDYYAITAIELAKHNKALVADIISEQSRTDAALYPMFERQINDLSSKDTMTVAALLLHKSYPTVYENKADLLLRLKKVDYSKPFFKNPFLR